jgi:hypothetical protein
MLQHWEHLEEAKRADRRARRKPDRAVNQYAGYGFTWQGPPGRRRRVEHQHEQRVIAWIVRYRREGYSWRELHDHLLENSVKTAKGSPWSVMRIRRAYRAAAEARRAPAMPEPERGQDDG